MTPASRVLSRLLPLVVLTGAGLSSVALTGCGDNFQDYYPDRQDPRIDKLTPNFEQGNIGGQLVTIEGSGFGDDPDEVIVLIDNHNAEILSVSDGAIDVRTPPGPITGGPVEVLVATGTGYTRLEPPSAQQNFIRTDDSRYYTYGTADFTEAGDFYKGQQHYVQVSNLFRSCYGGIGAGIGGCERSSFNGQTGIDGTAEFFRFSYPRLHTIRHGWLTAYDAAVGEWRVDTPDPVFPSGTDDLRIRLEGGLVLRNPEFQGDEVCVDMTDILANSPVPCTSSEALLGYDLGEMVWCEERDPVEGGQYEYSPDWPVNHDFFQGSRADGTAEIWANIPTLGLVNSPIVLPPTVDMDAELGFEPNDAFPFAIRTPSACVDSNEDGRADLADDGMRLVWTPLDPEALLEPTGLESPNDTKVEAVNSYIHVSFTAVDFAWYSLETVGVRVSAVFPDENDTFEDDLGNIKSSITIPNEVLYQIPTPNLEWSSDNGKLGEYEDNPRYLFMEVYRITDYKIPTERGPMVFSYSTGELTILTEWSNPVTRDEDCTDCLDGDNDGWVDDLDPDCNADYGGEEVDETNKFSAYTCNDGKDNNGDGKIDSNDPLCQAGWEGETTCGDEVDNDGDGWVDAKDPDCIGTGDTAQEDGKVFGTTCNDGLDNDGDGWIDAGDPGCENGLDLEDDGFLGTPCNDGIDQDEHGDPDHLDLLCILMGGAYPTEEPRWITGCSNGRDDDSDGFFDNLDPDCEYLPYNRETTRFHDPEDPTRPFVPACYDGIDNDGDGTVDAKDPSCWNPAYDFDADGFFNDEGGSLGTSCTDGADDDADGWIDGLDPDCKPGSPDTQTELGFDTSEDAPLCNDGKDNDGDGLIDAADDRYCKKGSDNYEGPS